MAGFSGHSHSSVRLGSGSGPPWRHYWGLASSRVRLLPRRETIAAGLRRRHGRHRHIGGCDDHHDRHPAGHPTCDRRCIHHGRRHDGADDDGCPRLSRRRSSRQRDAIVLLTAEVVDGDTINMSDGSTVRLIGIDTPERGQCGFEEASAVLAQLITGQSITLVPGAPRRRR